MFAAARVTDPTSHTGIGSTGSITGPGIVSVQIENLPAAVLGDAHACALPVNPPHPQTTLLPAPRLVLIGNRPAARVGDSSGCGALVLRGAARVVIGA
jgi:uncharacterized Zn-binding protein involved in type VI secretion